MIQATPKQTIEITDQIVFDNGYRTAKSLMLNGQASPDLIREHGNRAKSRNEYSLFHSGMDKAADDYENQIKK